MIDINSVWTACLHGVARIRTSMYQQLLKQGSWQQSNTVLAGCAGCAKLHAFYIGNQLTHFGADSLTRIDTTLQGKLNTVYTSKPAKNGLAEAGNAKRLQ